jgi:hypothetical protein
MQFPNTVYLNESFTVKLFSESKEIYDVKIFIQSDKIISQTYDEYWKSSNYYIKSSFPRNKEYQIKPLQKSDNSQICARLRKPEQSKYTEICKPIKISEKLPDNRDPILLVYNPDQISFISNRQKTIIFAFISFILLSLIVLILLVFKKI